MSRLSGLLLAPLVLAAAPALAAPGLPQVRAHLKAVQTMTANFSQTDANGKTLTGTLTLKQPGRIRFQYEPGVPLLIVSDGKALTFIDYKVRQVSRWPVGNSPLSLLLDPDKDLAVNAQVLPGPAGKLLVQGRDPKHPELGTMTLAFTEQPSAPAGLILSGWTVVDAQGNRSVLTLSDQRFNQPVKDIMFQFRDPRPQGRK